jgi:hypothetical protein
MAQVVEHLPRSTEFKSSIPHTQKEKILRIWPKTAFLESMSAEFAWIVEHLSSEQVVSPDTPVFAFGSQFGL